MKKILIAIIILCNICWSKCISNSDMASIRNAKVYLNCDASQSDGNTVIKSELWFWTEVIEIIYHHADGTITKWKYCDSFDHKYRILKITWFDDLGVIDQESDIIHINETIYEIYKEYRKKHNFKSPYDIKNDKKEFCEKYKQYCE